MIAPQLYWSIIAASTAGNVCFYIIDVQTHHDNVRATFCGGIGYIDPGLEVFGPVVAL